MELKIRLKKSTKMAIGTDQSSGEEVSGIQPKKSNLNKLTASFRHFPNDTIRKPTYLCQME